MINMLSYLHVSCVTRINLGKHIYIYIYRCILSGRKNVILHKFMYNVMSDGCKMS